ncbi:uracil-DNA glycosylase [Abyssisolibacter fermentans]|uniref:uracil-DNA glycosylase n=1 Tax=Abyssisolibacter fermentans TaxID=1766203 RepID=UPI0008379CE0|nr:uracil-DNA glycosylase [Abyssisolibacter fermentans]
MTLTELNSNMIEKFKEYELVLGDGNENSKIFLIGEAPGAKEVQLKKPFVGKAGENLNEFLKVLNLDRNDLYISNTVKFRPTKLSPKTGKPINRPPTAKEVKEFTDFLYEEISIVKPQIIVTLGNTPLKAVLGDKTARVGELHGKLLEIKILNNLYKLFPLYHPAAIIYNQKLKDVYQEDLKKLSVELK